MDDNKQMNKLLSLTIVLLVIGPLSLQTTHPLKKENNIQLILSLAPYLAGETCLQEFFEAKGSKLISTKINSPMLDGTDITALFATLSTIIIGNTAQSYNPEKNWQKSDPVKTMFKLAGKYTGRKLVTGSIFMLNWCSIQMLGQNLIDTEKHATQIKYAKNVAGLIGNVAGDVFITSFNPSTPSANEDKARADEAYKDIDNEIKNNGSS